MDARTAALERIGTVLRLVVAVAAILLAIWLIKDVLVVVFASALVAVILHGLATLATRFLGLPYWAALLGVVVLLFAAVVGLGMIAGPGLADQFDALRQALGGQLGALRDRLSQSNWGRFVLEQLPPSVGGNKEGGEPMKLPSGVAGSVAGILGSVLGLFGTLAVVAIAGIYLAASPGVYVNGALRLVPAGRREDARRLIEAAGKALWAWSAGQALDMVVVGVLSGLGLWLIGVPLAFVLGVVAGLFNFVPYIGAIVGAVPAVLLGFSVGTSAGLETIALYLVIQGFEGNVMAPLIQKQAVEMPPGLTILAQTAFGAILGIPGLIFATPLTAALLAVGGEATTPLQEDEKV